MSPTLTGLRQGTPVKRRMPATGSSPVAPIPPLAGSCSGRAQTNDFQNQPSLRAAPASPDASAVGGMNPPSVGAMALAPAADHPTLLSVSAQAMDGLARAVGALNNATDAIREALGLARAHQLAAPRQGGDA